MRRGREGGSARCRMASSGWPRSRPWACRGPGRPRWGGSAQSQVSEGELEWNVVLVHLALLHALGQEEAHVQGVLVGTDLGHAREFVGERQAQHLRGLFRGRLLVDALV